MALFQGIFLHRIHSESLSNRKQRLHDPKDAQTETIHMIRQIYSETILITAVTESGYFAHGRCCGGLALPNGFLSGRTFLELSK